MTDRRRPGLALALLALGSEAWGEPPAPSVPSRVKPVPGVSVEVTTEE